MELEDYVATLNSNIFLREFSFARNSFNPLPNTKVEFADHVVWIENLLMIYQLKERENPGAALETDEKWFKKKVLGRATKQIRDTLNYLSQSDRIAITNQRGHIFTVSNRQVTQVIKIVLYARAQNLPKSFQSLRSHISSTAGFIHILSIQDYFEVCRTLLTPMEIAEYFEFRERILRKWSDRISNPSEVALIGQFISGDQNESPSESYQSYFFRLQNEIDQFDISSLLYNFADRIEHLDSQLDNMDYYKILTEFAKLTRTEYKDIKTRVKLCLEACESDKITLPYRMIVPRTGCGFVFIPIPKNNGAPRLAALKNFTHAAKYDQKLQRCIGVSFAKEGTDFLIDWCLIDYDWQVDLEMEERLRKNYPFRKLREQSSKRYSFNDNESEPNRSPK